MLEGGKSRRSKVKEGMWRAMRIVGLFFCWMMLVGANAAIAADTRSKTRVGTPMKVLRYAQQLVQRYDDDGDGQLSEEEWSRMQGTPKLVDRNRDGAITVAEMGDHIARYGRRLRIRLMPAPEGDSSSFPSLLKPQEKPPRGKLSRLATQPDEDVPPGGPRGGTMSGSAAAKAKLPRRKFTVPASRLPKGLPSWFRVRDRDGDAQLTMAEFASDGEASAVKEFLRYDLNSDGMVTAQEALRASQMPVSRSRQRVEADAEESPDNLDEEADEAEPEDSVTPAATRVPSSIRDKLDLKKQQRAQRVRPDKPERREKPK